MGSVSSYLSKCCPCTVVVCRIPQSVYQDDSDAEHECTAKNHHLDHEETGITHTLTPLSPTGVSSPSR
ncbi:MAG: hypothetical protein Q8P67_28490 [archaeon]|nr:hypothetical protein [archaeon]